jgi:hypothetical protein
MTSLTDNMYLQVFSGVFKRYLYTSLCVCRRMNCDGLLLARIKMFEGLTFSGRRPSAAGTPKLQAAYHLVLHAIMVAASAGDIFAKLSRQ